MSEVLNLEVLHARQGILHKKIAETKGVDFTDWSVLDNLRYSFHVELTELANEIEFFKYWKTAHKNERAAQIEELSDCVHVLLAVCNVVGYTKLVKEATVFPLWEDAGYLDMFNMLRQNNLDNFAQVEMALSLVLGIGRKLGFTLDEIVHAYKAKNEKNIKRQTDGY